ncbi:hypothetical protein RCO27_07545 [Sphingosinicella sp. LHD-64]|uniref:hypothetical protein n=1 Tax=Sphingosinicella sp. LHD-64 TaxID=3072139 RepID=UPI00280EF520|nr:hypothetical protein [Sphingosinicella sp. LHD-64]MDQ8756082.1 hypothetical protein [Sphingosinicella sp. LHD-64]
MVRRSILGLIAAFLVGFFLVGLPHWSSSDRSQGFDDPAMIAGLAGLSMVAMMLVVGQIATVRIAWLTMSLCLPAAVAVRLALEASALPFWPVAIGLAAATGIAAILPGLLAGRLAQRLQSRSSGWISGGE